MPNYEHMYFILFNAITTAMRQILSDNTPAALLTLIEAQLKTEKQYIEDEG